MPLVLTQKLQNKVYEDEVERLYHYPNRYASYISAGERFVYYHPRERGDAAAYYFGMGRLGQPYADAERPDHWFVPIDEYVSFPRIVPFKDGGDYLEARPGVGTQFFRAVRRISEEAFQRIITRAGVDPEAMNETGISETFDEDTGAESVDEASSPQIYQPVMRVFYGPPGTGKTFQAAREAVRIIDGAVSDDPEQFSERHRQLVETKRIIWTTFHPSYTYEDFVEGFRPKEENGRITYEVVKGPFRDACDQCYNPHPLSMLRVGERIGQSDRFTVIDIEPGGVALKSENTRRDRVTDEIIQFADMWTIRRLQEAGVGADRLALAGKGATYAVRQEVARATSFPTTMLTNSSHYRALYMWLEQQASQRVHQPVVLVIDEINRADLSRVFGELITLVESDKREGELEERKVVLPYSKEQFSVPPCLSVIGTMNTADRSLAVVDLALRRRFEFVELEPDTNLCPEDYGGVNVQERLEQWNRRVSALLSRDHRLGHSELMRHKLERVRESGGWASDKDGESKALARVVRGNILPLLLEYFHDDWRKVDIVLGRNGLLLAVDFSDVAELSEDIVDFSDFSAFSVPDWWDPASDQWDRDKFVAALSV